MAKRRRAQGDGYNFSGMPIVGVGWRAIPNHFFDIYQPIMDGECPGMFSVFLHIWRETVGRDQKDVTMSIRWLAHATGMTRTRAADCIRWLVAYAFLKATPQPIKVGRGRNLPATTFSYRPVGQILDDIYTLPDPEEADPRPRPWLSPKLRKMLAAEAQIDARDGVRYTASGGCGPDAVAPDGGCGPDNNVTP